MTGSLKRIGSPKLIALLALVLMLGVVIISADSFKTDSGLVVVGENQGGPSIYLANRTIVPGSDAGNLKNNTLLANSWVNPEQKRYVIVQFNHLVGSDERSWLAERGATVMGYVPDQAFLVRTTNEHLSEIVSDPSVTFVGDLLPDYKVEDKLRQISSGSGGIGPFDREVVNVLVVAHPDEPVAPVIGDLRRFGARTVLEVDGDELKTIILVEVQASRLDGFLDMSSALEAVSFIEMQREYTLSNRYAAGITQSGTANTNSVWDKGLHGEGEIVGASDSGIDYDSCFFRDSSYSVPMNTTNQNHRKIVAYFNRADGKDLNNSGHGTHVNGSIAGKSITGTNSSSNGMAYEAKLAFTDIGGAGDSLPGIPSNLNTTLFPQPYGAGARIHSNSWGSPSSSYSSHARDVDQFMWNNKDFLILIAAGNDGPSSGTIGEPATAKNSVAVGATDNTTTGGNAANLAYFSSHGPTSDGRMKPDVTAPGNQIKSADSDGSTTSNNCGTLNMPGTSMATPVTAGNVALIRQFYREGWYPSGTKTAGNAFIPTGALLKATLVNGAVNMTGNYTATSGNSGASASMPTSGQGWGRIKIDNAMYFAGDSRKVEVWDESSGLSTNATWSKTVSVTTGQDFKVTVAWTDYPGTAFTSKALVNDLDLTVSGPSGTFKGNVFSSARSVTGGSADHTNNLEQVLIQSPSAGTYTITVKGYTVPSGPQDFAVVATGNLTGGSTVPTYSISGNVSNSAGGNVAGATVTLSGAGSTSTTTDGSGNYSIGGLLAGSYTVTPSKTGFSFSPSSRAVTLSSSNSTGRNFSGTFSGGDVLFVDDDKGKSFETYFTNALASSGYSYDVWNVQNQGSPDSSTLGQYSSVVWSTGDDYQDTLSATDESALQTYLNGGGNLMFSSQDYLYHRATSTTFETNYLHVGSFTNDSKATNMQGVSGDVISAGMSLTLTYPSGYTDYSDTVAAGSGATTMLATTDGKGGGIHYDNATYKVVFLAFPFEAIATGSSPSNREALMKRTLDWFSGTGGTPSTYTVSGTVIGPDGNGLSGASVAWSGTASGSTSSASNGSFSATGLSAGSYTFTPSKSGYTFSPSSRSVSVSSSDISGQNFNASATSSETALTSGVSLGDSVAKSAWKYYTISVPAGATQLDVSITGLSADVDLYTRFGSKPTASTGTYDCRPYESGTTSESCPHASPSAGTWYIGVNGYAAGSYTVTATVTMPAGDTTAPTTTISTGPTGTISTSSATFTWTGSDNTTSTGNLVYSSRLVGQSSTWSSYSGSTGRTFSGLTDGSYTFEVRARDEATNVDASAATRSFSVSIPVSDTTAPTTTVNSGPTGTITVDNASFTWSGSDNITSSGNLVFSYRLVGQSSTWSSYTGATSHTFTGLTNGSYTFEVRARDEAANVDASPATRAFSVSLAGPTVTALSNGVGVAGSVTLQAYTYYSISVPGGSTNLTVTLTGLTADVDLYTKFGSQPTTGDYTCQSWNGGTTNESCSHDSPSAGTWYISVYGYAAGNFTVTATVAGGSTINEQLLSNDGFENGTSSYAPWVQASDCYNQVTNAATYGPRTGTFYIWMAGFDGSTDSLYQEVTIPADASTATLSYWLRIDTQETTTTNTYDTLTVTLKNTSGTTVGTVASYGNLDSTTHGSYVNHSFNLASFAGQTVRVHFAAMNDDEAGNPVAGDCEDASYKPTSFIIDDVTLDIERPGFLSGGGKSSPDAGGIGRVGD